MMKRIVLLLFLAVPFAVFAQNKSVSGIVTDSSGEPVAGVSVLEKGTGNGVITDAEGRYTIQVGRGAVLAFSFLGFRTTEIQAGGSARLDVVLDSEATGLEETVVVGYRTVKKESLTGAVANITSRDIVTTKSPSLAVSLAGKVAGFNIRQENGQPGIFATSINIRGMGAPLFIIDGIVRDGSTEFQRLNPEDIESISFLKDGTAAIYGMNSSNGAVIVTTRKGRNHKPEISLSSNFGLSSPTYMPEMCTAAQWYELMVDGQVNIGSSPYISQTELEAWRAGGPGYESYSYYDALFKKVALRHQHTLSVSGGNDRTTYFASVGYTKDDGLLRKGNTSYDQFSIRSNVHTVIARNLTADINLYGMTGTRRQGFMNYQSVFFVSIVEPPVTSIYANGNPEYYNNFTYGINPVAGADEQMSGYDNLTSRSFQSLLSLNWSLPWVKGLELKAQASYDYNNSDTKVLGKAFNLYSYDAGSGTYTEHLTNSPASLRETAAGDDRLDLQLSANFDRSFGNHHAGAVIVFEGKRLTGRSLTGSRYYDFYTIDDLNYGRTNDMANQGWSSESRYLSYIGRFNYDYKGKYLAEFALRYDGSYRYSPQGRWALFPMGSLGWKLSDEAFIRDNVPFINHLKIRGSIGVSGQDAGDPFQYLAGYTLGSGGASFAQGSFTAGIASPTLINSQLTWYTARMYDLGLDFSLWEGRLGGEFDFFLRDRTGLLANRAVALPNTFGAELPQENLNADRTAGVEMTLSHTNNIGDFFYSIRGNVCLSRTRTVYAEEASFNSSWDRWRNQATDRWQNVVWGYRTAGQFHSVEDLSTLPVQDGTVGNDKELPGDYIIEDVNGDGHIDAADMLPLFWGGTPLVNYGLTISASWRGFDFSMLFQGAGGYTVRYMDCYGTMLYQLGNTPAYFMDRWHYADPYDTTSGWVEGYWPAIRPDGYAGAMYYNTDLWRRDATYLRLKSVELGYTFSPRLLGRAGIRSLRLYFNGNNLLTFCDQFVKAFDPEKTEGDFSSGINYPLTKCFNFGFILTL